MKKKFKEIPITLCPECNSHIFYKDITHAETYCLSCGLILKAPYSTEFTTPDYKTITLTVTISEDCIK